MSRILIAEDEPGISGFVAKGLASAGYETVIADDGVTALEIALQGGIDLVLLDIGLPSMDGFEVVTELRSRGLTIPVIMLTARTSIQDTVTGLEAGASDYIPKPFTFDELIARVRVRLREGAAAPATTVSHEGVSLDLMTRRATADGRNVDLSAREFALAEQFIRNAGKTLTREQLLSSVWGMDFDPGSNVVDVYVRYLRGKFGQRHIETVRGEGYRWQ